ncbi:MAG: hypothetical protein MHPSP_003623 [Paramarteilia canceri]
MGDYKRSPKSPKSNIKAHQNADEIDIECLESIRINLEHIIKYGEKLLHENIPSKLDKIYWFISGLSDNINKISIRKLALIRCKEKLVILKSKDRSKNRKRQFIRDNFLFETNRAKFYRSLDKFGTNDTLPPSPSEMTNPILTEESKLSLRRFWDGMWNDNSETLRAHDNLMANDVKFDLKSSPNTDSPELINPATEETRPTAQDPLISQP